MKMMRICAIQTDTKNIEGRTVRRSKFVKNVENHLRRLTSWFTIEKMFTRPRNAVVNSVERFSPTNTS